jgi:hypothetical protein
MRARTFTYGTAVSNGWISTRAIIRHCLTDSVFLFARNRLLTEFEHASQNQGASIYLEAVQAFSKG